MATGHNKRGGDKHTDLGGVTQPADFRAAAETVEANTDSAWALWQEANAKTNASFAPTAPFHGSKHDQADPRYAQTVPAGLEHSIPAAAPVKAAPAKFVPHAKAVTVEEAMVEARKNNRVCPRPDRWKQVFDMLPDKAREKPSQPPIGGAWAATPSISKRMVLREHLDWAAARGALGPVFEFLKALPENEWHHMDD